MTLEELKIRQLTNQYLLAPADKLTVMRDRCGVQAQFMTNALLSLKLRTNDYDEQTVAEGLVKNWSVRGTVHVFAESDLPLFIRCNNGADYRKNEWQGYSYMKNQRPCWALTPKRQKYLADIIISAVSERAYTRDKLTVTVRAADESYHGKAMLCGKCKTMLAVIEKPKVARGYVAIPVTSATF